MQKNIEFSQRTQSQNIHNIVVLSREVEKGSTQRS